MYEPILVFNKKLNLHLSFVMNNLSVLPRIIFSLIKLSRVVEHEAIDIQVTQGQKLDVLSSGSFHLRGRRTSLRFYLWSSYYITWSDRDNPCALLSTLYSLLSTLPLQLECNLWRRFTQCALAAAFLLPTAASYCISYRTRLRFNIFIIFQYRVVIVFVLTFIDFLWEKMSWDTAFL